jgi:hypothetical protein
MFNPNQAFAKVEISPQGLYTRSQDRTRKILSICPKLLLNAELYGLVLAPRLEKGIPSNLRGQFATLEAKVRAFISKLGPNNKPKMLKVGPQKFSALTPSVKRA